MQGTFTFTSEDIHQYCLDQLEKDSRNPDFLSVDEYRQMLSMLLQAEQTIALASIARNLDTFRISGLPVENVH